MQSKQVWPKDMPDRLAAVGPGATEMAAEQQAAALERGEAATRERERLAAIVKARSDKELAATLARQQVRAPPCPALQSPGPATSSASSGCLGL